MIVSELIQALASVDPAREVVLDYSWTYATIGSLVDVDDCVMLAAYCPLCEYGSTNDQLACEHPGAAGRPERAEKKEEER